MADLILSRLRRTLQNWFTTKIGFEGAEQGSQPTQPASGYRQLYAKSDGWYDQDDGGVETKIGAGGGLPDTFEGTAGEALSQYNVVYSNSADSGELWKATNAGTATQADAIGIVTESGGISDTATGTVTRLGEVTNGSWSLTPGGEVWLGTAGAITQTMPSAGDYAKPLGWAITATKIWFAPQNGWLVGYDIDLTEIPAENDGRITLVSTTQIKWDGHRVTLWDPTKGRDVQVIPSSVPTLDYDDTDLDSNALVAAYPYDLFLEYSSATACTIVAKKWTDATTRAVSPALWHGRYRYDNTTDAGKKRLWIGTVYLDTGPVFKDEKSLRYISNFYNSKPLIIGVDNPYSSETYDNPTDTNFEGWAGSSTTWKAQFVLCDTRRVSLLAMTNANTYNSYGVKSSIGIDSASARATDSLIYTLNTHSTEVVTLALLSSYNASLGAGYHYALPLQARVHASSDRYIYFYHVTHGKTASFDGSVLG